MGQTAGELRQEIDGKRQDASEKIEQLEQKVTGAADQVMQTKDQVTEQVMQTKEQVVDTVMQAKDQVMQFDWRKQVDEKPLVALGAAFIGGVVLGNLLNDGDDGRYRSGIAPSYGSTPTYGAGSNYPAMGEPGSAARSAGVMGIIRNAAKSTGLEETFNDMTSSFMSTLSQRVKQVANDVLPGMTDKLQNTIEGVANGGASSAGGTAPQHPSPGGTGNQTSMPATSDYARSGEFGSTLSRS